MAELFLPLPGKIQNGKMHHLVHAVVLDLSVFRVKSNEIVVFVIPHQAPRAYLIPGSVTAKFHFLLHIPPVILKTDLPAAVYGIVQEIDIVVNTLVHGFGTAGNQHLTVKIPRLMHTRKRFEFFDQLAGLLFSHKPGGLHRIDQQLQFRQLKTAGIQVIQRVSSDLLPENLQAEAVQFIQILVQCPAVNIDAAVLQTADNLLCGETVFGVRFLRQNALQIQHLQFLIYTGCHGRRLLLGDGFRALPPDAGSPIPLRETLLRYRFCCRQREGERR